MQLKNIICVMVLYAANVWELSKGKLPKTEENYSICTCNATVIEAWNYCQCRNQVLATIRSKKQEKCFQAKLEQVQISLVWIGLYVIPVTKQHVWMDGRCLSKYTLKKFNKIRNRTDGHPCAAFNGSSDVEFHSCDSKINFACQDKGSFMAMHSHEATCRPEEDMSCNCTDTFSCSENVEGNSAAEEASRFLKNMEGKFLRMVIDGESSKTGDGYQLQITRLKSNQSKLPMPLASFKSTTVYNVLPHQEENASDLFAVMAQIQINKSSLDSLNKNKTVAYKNYAVENFVLNKSTILIITAVQLTSKKQTKIVNASAAFSFALAEQDVLEGLSSHERNALSGSKPNKTLMIKSVSVSCSYLDEDKHLLSGRGCTSEMADGNNYICKCSHTSAFAVLLSVTTFAVPQATKILSLVFESLSVTFLLLTITILAKVRRRLRNSRTFVQINLSVALLLLHLCNLFHDVALRNKHTCEVAAVFMHYFLLASAAWMLVEGITLVRKTVGALESAQNARRAKILSYLMGWCLPAIIVLLTVTIGFIKQTYMQKVPSLIEIKYQRCWINHINGTLQLSVLTPVLLVLAINGFISLRMAYFVYIMSFKAEAFKPTQQRNISDGTVTDVDMTHVKASLKAVSLMLPTLGLPWILGMLTSINNYEASVTFMYLNTVVNGLQGTGLFLIYCVLNSEVRSVVRRISERNRITFVPNGNKPLRRISRLRREEASFRTTSEEGSNVIRANYSPGIFSQLPK